LLRTETRLSFSSETFIWVIEGEDFTLNSPQDLYKCPLHLQYGAVYKVSNVSTIVLLFQVRGADPQCIEFVKTLVVSPGGFSTTNMQFTIIKYTVLVEKLFLRKMSYEL
jgi:hypothetical protein